MAEFWRKGAWKKGLECGPNIIKNIDAVLFYLVKLKAYLLVHSLEAVCWALYHIKTIFLKQATKS